MSKPVSRDIFALIQFEWVKRFQFPFIEILMIILLFELFPSGVGTRITRSLEQVLIGTTNSVQRSFYGIDRDFLFIAILITLLVTTSLGREYETNILKTTLVQTRISKKKYFLAKLLIDLLFLNLIVIASYIFYTYLYGYLTPWQITFSFYVFYISKIVFAYALALMVTVWRKQMLQPLLICLLIWFFVPLVGPIVFNKNHKPWYFLFNLHELNSKSPFNANILLLLFSVILIMVSALLFLGASYIYQNNDL